MKYVILIHSNPQPWGHPTGDYNAAFQALPPERRAQLDREFEELLTRMRADGELVGGEALGDPATASVYRWEDDAVLATDGPYSEVKEHLAGFFLIDVADRERAEEIAQRFASPGDTIELRPAMWPGGADE
ncbi:YciI family protein [Nocardioides sp. LHG3406-4]|uniref:YciI family protein n=1 Tax=Nocardioides sp. LHG3406-4 TaxID=2804575 RepID=UPI003CFAF89A